MLKRKNAFFKIDYFVYKYSFLSYDNLVWFTASGTFNSGLLATLVGTGGRSMGDAIITIMGLISIRNLQNLLFVPSFILQLLMLYLVWTKYHLLIV